MMKIKVMLNESHPKLALEWNHERNGKLTPDMVSRGTARKVWWRCSYGHEWEAYIYSRSAGCGCPYCAGNKVLPGYNDLPSTRPELLTEWDFEKNADISPENVAEHTNRKVWWKCKRGHRWQAPVYVRTAGKGCPVCSGRKILAGFNDLASQRPEMLMEWDYEKNTDVNPTEVSVYSHRKVWWKGTCGHRWQASVAKHTYGDGCPYCAGKKVLVGFNDLASSHAIFLDEWDYEKNSPITPETVTRHSRKKIWWKCKQGHHWQAAIGNRYRTGCPFCTNRKVLVGFNDLQTVHPELCDEWDFEKNKGLTPQDVLGSSRRKVWWRCFHGHSWYSEIYNRHIGQKCPYCCGVLAYPGFNDLQTIFPHIAAEWDSNRNGELTPDHVLPFSSLKVWWVCENGHGWQASINSRSQGAGCPHCAGFRPYKRHFVP